ncbi:MAG: hypothetical protein Q9163_000931 [Psora crenata]
MGLQAYITRVALGRSAFQSPAGSSASTTHAESSGEAAERNGSSTQLINPSEYSQEYNSKGYAINPASTEFKRRMIHAQNDVLATVGVCAKIDSSTGSRKLRSSGDSFRVDGVKSENESGMVISTVDIALMSLIEPCTVGLRQRLEGPGLPRPLSWTTAFNYLGSVAVMPLVVISAISYIKPAVKIKLYEYIRAALPKPTHPDRYSLQAAHEDEFDGETILGLIDDGATEYGEAASAINLLANDLQAIGRSWQILRDKCSNFITMKIGWLSRRRASVDSSRNPSSSTSTTTALSVDLREAMASMPETMGSSETLSAPPTNVLALRSGVEELLLHSTNRTRAIDDGQHGLTTPSALPPRSALPDSGFPTSPQDQSPRPGEQQTSAPAHSTDEAPQRRDSSFSSIIPSRLSTPSPPIEITASTAHTGTRHMHVTIPAGIPDGSSQPNQGFQAPSASSTDTDSSYSASEDVRIFHRATTLSVHAAEAMAQHLSLHLAHLLLLPLESLFVRSVAMTFWSAPGLSIASRGGAGRWREDVNPLGSWFGAGLKAVGWRGAMDYAVKIFLIWVTQVGMGFAVWEFSTGFMWWAGLRWHDWRNL